MDTLPSGELREPTVGHTICNVCSQTKQKFRLKVKVQAKDWVGILGRYIAFHGKWATNLVVGTTKGLYGDRGFVTQPEHAGCVSRAHNSIL